MTPLRVAVTGGSGFVGGVVVSALAAAGFEVTILSRHPVVGHPHRHYDLSAPVPTSTLEGFATIIHCAYDLAITQEREIRSVNVDGTRRLLEAADRAGGRVILVSSMSAYPGTEQLYGSAKLHSEADVISAGGEAVRLGLVWGGAEGGMIGSLRRLARLPLIPSFGSDLHQYMVHVDDLGPAFVALVGASRLGKPVGLAHPDRVPFSSLIRDLRNGRPPRFVPVPWRPTYEVLRLAERAGLHAPVRADSLLGLVKPAREVPHVGLWHELGVELRSFSTH